MAGDEVEGGGAGVAGEQAVVEAEQTDGFEGQGAHGHHVAEGDAAAQKAGFALAAEEAGEVEVDDGIGQFAAESGQFGFLMPAGECLFELP